MLLYFIKNQFKETFRSSYWKKSMVSNFFIVVLYFLMALNFLAIGLYIDKILDQTAPGGNHITVFNGLILIYFFSELLIRFFIQKIHSIKVVPYLHLPVKKSFIKNYLLVKPFFNVFNITQYFIALPFAIKILPAEHSSAEIFSWLIFLFFFIQIVNYFNLLVSRLSFISSYIAFIYMGTLIILTSTALLDYIDVKSVSAAIFNLPLADPINVLYPLAGLAIMYWLNYRLLNNRFYIDEIKGAKKSSIFSFSNFNFVEKYGEIGSYISLELKLLLRNKRPRSTMFFGIPMLLIGFVAYGNEAYKGTYFSYVYFGIFIVSMFMIFYGQFIFAWESSYFDAIIGKNIQVKNYLKAKYFLLVGLCTVSFLISLLYGILDYKIIIANVNLYLFSVGFSSYFLIFLGTYSRKRLDIQVGLMSMQGKGANQFIVMLPILLLPILLSLPVYLLYNDILSFCFLGFLGLIGLAFHKQIMNFLYRQFLNQKYKLATAFREAE